ncbi:MAG: integration host factor subunit alpha [Magnetococcales bacterium]|nr:integration host factor subunit alpha [Magnetococcales bacterium]
MANTTKPDIVMAVQELAGTSRHQSAAIVEAVFEAVSQQLEQGESVKLPGFGVFDVRAKRARRGRNPKTGSQTEISARHVVVFRSSRILRGHVATPIS